MDVIGGGLVGLGAIQAVHAHVRQRLGLAAHPALWSGVALLGAVLACVA